MTPPQLCPAITELGWRWGRPEFAASFLTAQHSESSGPSDGVPGGKVKARATGPRQHSPRKTSGEAPKTRASGSPIPQLGLGPGATSD